MAAALGRQPWDVIIADHSCPTSAGSSPLLYRSKGWTHRSSSFPASSTRHGGRRHARRARDFIKKGHLARLVPAIQRELREVRELRARAADNVRLFEEARRSSQEWSETFDAMPELVCLLSADYSIVRANLALANLAGRPAAEGSPG
jgi:PAS domain-containing protein